MVEIDLKTLLVQVFTFLIGAFLLWKTGIRYFAAILEKRKEQIKKDLDQAQNTRLEVEKIKADFEKQLAEMKQRSQQRLAEAVQEGNQQKARMLEETKAEAKALLDKASQDIERQMQSVKKEIKNEVVSLAMQAAEKVVGRTVDQAAQKKLVEDFLKDLAGSTIN